MLADPRRWLSRLRDPRTGQLAAAPAHLSHVAHLCGMALGTHLAALPFREPTIDPVEDPVRQSELQAFDAHEAARTDGLRGVSGLAASREEVDLRMFDA